LQPEWPADKVERRAVAALIPYARNARTHSPEQVDDVAVTRWQNFTGQTATLEATGEAFEAKE
jgi:hypothetical protein